MNNIIKEIKKILIILILGIVIGTLCGFVGALFHILIDLVTKTRETHKYILFLLPLIGLIIIFLYDILGINGLNTNNIFNAINKNEKLSIKLIPGIFFGTILSHLGGASVGREGAALQLGGTIGHGIGRLFKINTETLKSTTIAGMGGAFSALFGTPIASTFFALEITTVGVIKYNSLILCFISSIVASQISKKLGITPLSFNINTNININYILYLKVIALALLVSIVAYLFYKTLILTEKYSSNLIKNPYIKIIIEAIIIILISVIEGTYDYNGAGMNIVNNAINGKVIPYAFILKIIITAISLSAGFKGGEVVPIFFIGSTFGAVLSPLLGIDASLSSSLSLIGLFAALTNAPIASIMLSLEIFGNEYLLLYAIIIVISFKLTKKISLYKSQEFNI